MTPAWALGAGALGIAVQTWGARARLGRCVLPSCFCLRRAWALLTGYVLIGMALRFVFWWLPLQLEQHSALVWATVALGAGLCGARVAVRSGRPVGAELLWAGVAIMQCAIALAMCSGQSHTGFSGQISPAALRALVAAPAALALWSYFGASMGLVLWPEGRLRLRLSWEAPLARRLLLSRSSQVLSVVTSISVLGVALGVWLVLVSLGILSGFENDLTDKIIGANAHVTVQPVRGVPFAANDEALPSLARLPGVAAVAPVLEAEVAIASESNYAAAALFGIDPLASPATLRVLTQLTEGSLATLALPAARIVLGTEMARSLNVHVGDQVRLISPSLEVLTPLGVVPKSMGVEVAAIFSSRMYEYDARYIFLSLPVARRFLELGATAISGYQLACTEPEQAPNIGQAALVAVQAAQSGVQPPLSFETLDWKRRNQTLFSALKLERVVAFIVLVFIILVASFSIVNTLSMSVLEKRREIAILKTMGAHDTGVAKVFLVQGLLIGGLGTLMGCTAGVLTLLALGRLGLWIPSDVYYIDALPVRLEVQDVVLVMVAALVIVWDFAVYPAYKGAQGSPVEGLRDG